MCLIDFGHLLQVFNGGIVMVTFYNYFVKCQENASVRDVAGKSEFCSVPIVLEKK